jgi:hypothetical protein
MGQVLNKTPFEADFKRWLPARGKETFPIIYKEARHKWVDDREVLESAAYFALGFMDATTKNLHHIKNDVYDIGYNEGKATLSLPRVSGWNALLNRLGITLPQNNPLKSRPKALKTLKISKS